MGNVLVEAVLDDRMLELEMLDVLDDMVLELEMRDEVVLDKD